jgi:cytochrome c oxidase subunit 1
LITPQGDLGSPDFYNRLFTMHGVIMVWFFLIPSIPATMGNFVIPLMIGARDLAFPRLNLLSWYLYIAGGLITIAALLLGGIDTGWTFYEPYSTFYATGYIILALFGIFVAGFSSILTGLNFIVTVHKLRAPGMTWYCLPVFVWSTYATSLILVLATPVLAMTLLMLLAERVLHVGIFSPQLGGDPLLFQHMFWFYSHPAVYIMILPSMGVISEVVPVFAGKRLFGYEFVVWCSIAIAAIGFLVWGHHMFVSGQALYASLAFSFLSYLVAVPSAIKVFNWTATLHEGWIRFDAPMLYAFGFIGLFTIGGLTGLFLAAMGLDIHMHDTYFVVAHFHYIMVGGAIMGYLGMPRRYHMYPPEFQVFNVMSTLGATVLAVGYLLPMFYFTYSIFRGKPAPADPWGAKGLEWEIPSPPPTENFAVTPIVTHGTHQNAPSKEVGIV